MQVNEVQHYYIECLKKELEVKVGRNIDTSSDFNFLYLELKKHISDSPSVSTLKRLWAYVQDNSIRSRGTLNALTRYLGYTGWTSYVESLMRRQHIESEFIDAKTLLATDIRKNDIIQATWAPDRFMQIVALGNSRFEVTASSNAKLSVGTTFTAIMFSRGLPLMCTDVQKGDLLLGSYVAGSDNGLTSLRLIPVNNSEANDA